jgi:hypothetical protein
VRVEELVQLLDEKDLGQRLVGEALAIGPVGEQEPVEVGRHRRLGPEGFDLGQHVRVVAGQLVRQALLDAGEILGELERRCKGQIACGHGGAAPVGAAALAGLAPGAASRCWRRTAISVPMAVLDISAAQATLKPNLPRSATYALAPVPAGGRAYTAREFDVEEGWRRLRNLRVLVGSGRRRRYAR